MKVDLIIRGGTIADGTGGALYEADVAVQDGKIVAIGKLAEHDGVEELDARGLLVTPGFIDPHTHYDGQLTWSDRLDPSSGHGVTTVTVGNCGVGFAPCRPQDREALVRLMEGVEDIPEIVMAEGLPWNWESFPDFLNAVDARPHDIDFAVLLPHAAMRVATMGQRAVDHEPSNEADRAAMRAIATEAMAAGAAGFSTSRSIFHKASDGNFIPTISAHDVELREIAQGMADAGRGVIQAIIMNKEMQIEDFDRLHDIAAESQRPLSYTMIQVPWDKDLWRRVGQSVDRYNAAGTQVRMQVFNRPVGMILGLDTTFNPFIMNPLYADHIAHLPVAEQVARMRDPEVRRQLLEPGPAIDHPLAFNLTRFGEMYPMGEHAEYEPDPASAIGAQAEARGISPLEVAYDTLLAQNGTGKILVASTNFDDGHLDSTLEMMRHEHAVIALGDGGAHYGLICDSSYSTFMLSHWTRDRKREGRLSIEEAVRMMTDKPAKLQRFHDRGRIAPGLRADLNVIDMNKLKLFAPHVVHDLPAGGRRLTQRADGYVATYVAGTAIRREGEDLGKRPGKLIRNGGI